MKPLLKPALHTLWQSLAAGLATWYASVNLGQVHGVDDAKKLALSAVAAAGAALLSGLYHAAKLYGPAAVNRVLSGRVNKAELFLIDQALDTALAAAPKWDLITRDNSAPVLAKIIERAKAGGVPDLTATTDADGNEWPEGPAPDAHGSD